MNGLGHERLGRMVKHHHRLALKNGTTGLISFNHGKVADKDQRDIVVKANTDHVDLDDEIVVPGGADMAYYLENGKNFIDHKYATEYAVGQLRSIKLSSDKTAWTNRSHIFSGLKSPFADDLLAMTKQAGIGASIGFEMIEGSPPTDRDPVSYRKAGFIIRKWRMVELSFTAMPCNVSCRTMHETGMDQEDEKMAIIDTMITKSAIRLESAVALGFPYRKSVSVATPKRRVGTVIRMSGLDTAVRFV